MRRKGFITAVVSAHDSGSLSEAQLARGNMQHPTRGPQPQSIADAAAGCRAQMNNYVRGSGGSTAALL